MTIPRITLSELPTLNPTFHPLIPVRLFLAAMSHESYHVLGDESYFFKGAAKKLEGKFSTPPPLATLRFLFQFCNQVNWLHLQGGKAELALDTLYHVNFHEAGLIYFCHFLSCAFGLFPLFRKADPQTWFLRDAVQALLQNGVSPPAKHSYLRRDLTAEAPHIEDLVALGFLTEKTIDGTAYIQLNPWYHEWVFDHIPSLKRKRHSDFGQRFIVQPNYDILMPPDLAWPSFLQLIALTKTEQSDLVCRLKLSKASILSALSIGIEGSEMVSFFLHNAWSVPENVKKSLVEWSSLPAPKRHPARSTHDGESFHLDELRREANHWLTLATLPLPSPAPTITPRSTAVLTPLPRLAAAVPEVETKPLAYRDNLIFLEECIREKKPCVIVHSPREGRTKSRSILPLRIHRDGISVFIEAEDLDFDTIRSFKLNHILEISN